MTTEIKLFLKNSVKYDIILGLSVSIILYAFFGENIAFIYFFGLIVSIINFILSGVILDKSLNGTSSILKFIFPVTYVARIACVAFIAIIFAKEISYLISYLGGFISHFPIIIFSWIRKQKGSE